MGAPAEFVAARVPAEEEPRGRRGVEPTARADAVLLPVLEDVDHRGADLRGAREITPVVAVAPDGPLAAEGLVDGTRDADREPLEAGAERPRAARLDHEVDMIALHGEGENAEVLALRAGEGLLDPREDGLRAEERRLAPRAEGDMHGHVRVVARPGDVGHVRPPLPRRALSAGPRAHAAASRPLGALGASRSAAAQLACRACRAALATAGPSSDRRLRQVERQLTVGDQDGHV